MLAGSDYMYYITFITCIPNLFSRAVAVCNSTALLMIKPIQVLAFITKPVSIIMEGWPVLWGQMIFLTMIMSLDKDDLHMWVLFLHKNYMMCKAKKALMSCKGPAQ